MRKFLSLMLGVAVCVALAVPAIADELKVNIGIESGDKATQVVGADVYATIDGKLYEITVAPDKLPFKANLKAGALRLKSFWMTEKQATK